MFFNKDYSFRGTHAVKVKELTASFDNKGNKLFARNLDVYILAPIIGFMYSRTSELDNSGETTNILYDAMSRETNTLWFNYRLIMLLDKQNEPDFTKRIEKAFRYYGTDQAKPDEDLYESYVRGGVDFIYGKLIIGSMQPGDYLRKLYEFLGEFDERYSHKCNEILDLVRLANG